MLAKERNELLAQFQIKANSILVKKWQDYSNEDVLSSFKETAEAEWIEPYRVAEIFIATKRARLKNLIEQQGKSPQFESIEDTILDMYNYVFLLYLLIKEKDYAPNWIKEVEWDEPDRLQGHAPEPQHSGGNLWRAPDSPRV